MHGVKRDVLKKGKEAKLDLSSASPSVSLHDPNFQPLGGFYSALLDFSLWTQERN